MKPIEFEGSRPLNPAKGTENRVQPLPMVTDGFNCMSFWEISGSELDKLLENQLLGKPVGIWCSVNSGNTQPPILLSVETLKPLSPLAYMLCFYQPSIQTADGVNQLFVWNSVNDMPPPVIEVNGTTLYFKPDKVQPVFKPDHQITVGSHYFRYPTPEEGKARLEQMEKDIKKVGNLQPSELEEVSTKLYEMAFSLPALVRREAGGIEKVIC